MTQKEFAQRLHRRARKSGVVVTPALADKLWTYFDLLFRWNKRINLTSLTPDAPDEAIDRLLLEPLLAARQVEAGDRQLIDIGSGGGSPALPLKLVTPHVALVMVESKARKSAFLREALRQLDVPGTVETTRFEELLARPEFHESFEVLTLRAVRADSRTLTSLQAFVRPGGRVLLFRRSAETRDNGWLSPPLRWKTSVPLTPGSELAVLEKLRIP